MLISLTTDIKVGFHILNEKAINDMNRLELLSQFIKLYDFQSEARQLSEFIVNIYHGFASESRSSIFNSISVSKHFEDLFVNFRKRVPQSLEIFVFGVPSQYAVLFFCSKWKALSISLLV